MLRLGQQLFLQLAACTHEHLADSLRSTSLPRPSQGATTCAGGLVQGRRWAEVRSRLADMWAMALRCADDIKESVRVSAAGALRVLRGLTLRLCDPAATPPADAGEAVALALPLLLDQGMRELATALHLFLLPLLFYALPGVHCRGSAISRGLWVMYHSCREDARASGPCSHLRCP